MADLTRKTANIYDKYHTIELTDLGTRYGQYVDKGTYSIYNDTNNIVYWFANGGYSRFRACEPHSTATVSLTEDYNNVGFYMAYNDDSLGDVSIVQGSTAPDHYIPYWQHSLRKLTTATEAVENPLYSDGTAITAYTIKGSTVQNGTPTPDNPIMPQGCGDIATNMLSVYRENYSINANGEETYNNVAMIYKANVGVSGSTFTLDFGGLSTGDTVRIHAYTGDIWKGQNAAITITQTPFVFAVASEVDNIRISIRKTATDVTLTDGQYKIPISNGQQTTPIYLESASSTRQIKKYVVTGNEAISHYDYDYQRFLLTIPTIPSMGTRLTPIICTHYIGIYDGRPIAQVPMYAVYTGSDTDNSVLIKTDQTTDRSTFIAWLREQYANGTPVTLWYAVATPETAAVNEPLMKIGDYSDTLSNATAIPTTEGANSITVDTTVQPSEFTATWTGWHDANVKEWDGSDWS